MITTIKLNNETKNQLDNFKEHKNESYDEIIKKLVFIVKQANKDPVLCKEALLNIKKSREILRARIAEERAIYNTQKIKMKEVWDNKEDEFWNDL